jgi:ATP-dependent DNA helicase DinG
MAATVAAVSPPDIAAALARVTAALPGGGEVRPGQAAMAEAVGRAIADEHHLVVQAGTGIGKSLAYLVPALQSGKRVVVTTATKALQDQLAGKDLPFLAAHLGRTFTYAVLKGRSNYVCRQRLAEISGDAQLALDGLAQRASPSELALLQAWAADSPTGDRAELLIEPSPQAWTAVSVSAQECPGAQRCPKGDECFAEVARRRAADADVVVVNTHLYGLDLESRGVILPEHDVVVIDEAHLLEDIVSDTFGLELGSSRFTNLARAVRTVIEEPTLIDDVDGSGALLSSTLVDHVGRRLRGALDPDLAAVLTLARNRLDRVMNALRAVADKDIGDLKNRKARAMQLTGALQIDLAASLAIQTTSVAWVEGPEDRPTLRVAPIDVAEVLRETLWTRPTVVLTSATIPPLLGQRLGLDGDEHVETDVGSPFDYEHQALLYCAAHLPDPREAAYEPAMHDELEALIRAAGGRTLALFTSWRAMDAAAEALAGRLETPVLTQRDMPKPALVAAFQGDESASLFATMGFWQGIDVPGRTLSLVAIDRLPFPRPDDPLLQARRERAKADAFRLVDLSRAATMLAQGAGRLIRSHEDRGVVAVLDPRLAKTKAYRWEIIGALPPMRRTRERGEAEAFLRDLRAA